MSWHLAQFFLYIFLNVDTFLFLLWYMKYLLIGYILIYTKFRYLSIFSWNNHQRNMYNFQDEIVQLYQAPPNSLRPPLDFRLTIWLCQLAAQQRRLLYPSHRIFMKLKTKLCCIVSLIAFCQATVTTDSCSAQQLPAYMYRIYVHINPDVYILYMQACVNVAGIKESACQQDT